MRRRLLQAALALTLVLVSSLAFAFSTGPPVSRTGAFAVAGKSAEPNCSLCHSGSPLNDPTGSVELLDLPDTVKPGNTYPLRLRLAHIWTTPPGTPLRWGFEIQAVNAVTGDSAGTWSPIRAAAPDSFLLKPGLSTSVWRYRRYLQHSFAAIREGEPGPAEWHIEWTPGPADTGKIYFFFAGNSANGDGLSIGSGDFIFTGVDSTISDTALTVGVAPRPWTFDVRTALEAPYPNPMWHCTDITFTLDRAGPIDVGVFDLQGRRVRTIARGWREPGSYGEFWSGQRDDGAYAKNGVYFIRLEAAGLRKPLTQKITLAR